MFVEFCTWLPNTFLTPMLVMTFLSICFFNQSWDSQYATYIWPYAFMMVIYVFAVEFGCAHRTTMGFFVSLLGTFSLFSFSSYLIWGGLVWVAFTGLSDIQKMWLARKAMVKKALVPIPSFKEFEAAIDGKSDEELCNALYALIKEKHSTPKRRGSYDAKDTLAPDHKERLEQSRRKYEEAHAKLLEKNDGLQYLRVLDMLFCEHEGKKAELLRRRRVVFEKFLQPMVLRCVKEPQIDSRTKKMILHVFEASAGGELGREGARDGYVRKRNLRERNNAAPSSN